MKRKETTRELRSKRENVEQGQEVLFGGERRADTQITE